jgi:hypothetical protein
MVVYISVALMNSSVFHHMPDTLPAKNAVWEEMYNVKWTVYTCHTTYTPYL